MELIKRHRSFGGWQEIHKHASHATGTEMRFAVYLPPQAASARCPIVYFLSGLTCTEENFITKSAFQQHAAKHGLIVVAPDTSPRGANLPHEAASWDFGLGAGFYVNATVAPWSKHYRMYDYVAKELPALVEERFPVRAGARGIMGHSMGGHGALIMALREKGAYRSVSAFSPIVAPMQCPWGEKALTGYLGSDRKAWEAYDATALVADGARAPGSILIDQGLADDFLVSQLKPELFERACEAADQPLELRRHDGYDHSYYFIQSFIGDHMLHHASQLGLKAHT